MQENDDKLLEEFFAAGKQEIADNGFTHRVMRHLPNRESRLSRIWTTFCFTLSIVLFIAFDGLQLMLNMLREVLDNLLLQGQVEMAQTDPKSIILAGVVLVYFVYRKIASLA